MSVTEEEVLSLGKLSRIAIEKKELKTYVAQITRVLDLANLLDGAETEGVLPLSHPLDLKARLRKDSVTEEISLVENMRSSSDVSEDLYIVPKVID